MELEQLSPFLLNRMNFSQEMSYTTNDSQKSQKILYPVNKKIAYHEIVSKAIIKLICVFQSSYVSLLRNIIENREIDLVF